MSKPKGYGENALRLLKKVCWDCRIKMVWSRPMAKGTYQMLREKLPKDAISNKKLYAALCCHSHSPAYLKAICSNVTRLAPGGVPSGRVSVEEAKYSHELVATYKPARRKKSDNYKHPNKASEMTAM